VVLVDVPRTESLLPDLKLAKKQWAAVHSLMKHGRVLAASAVRNGGVGHTLARMSFGNRVGVALNTAPSADFLVPNYGSIILEVESTVDLSELSYRIVGKTQSAPVITWPGVSISIDELLKVNESVLEPIFPTKANESAGEPLTFDFNTRLIHKPKVRVARPRVIIPVFPGSNCEYDTARAFNQAGAESEILVLRNGDAESLTQSLQALAEAIKRSQILMIPGGFSAGDEPDGSGKFIAAVLKSPVVRDATMDLLKSREGLILGICNGFQALIKTGLVPYGEIRDVDHHAPTLFYNYIGRHISRYAYTRVASVKSPWLSKMSVGQQHTIPFSHGEGRFVASPGMIDELARHGQIAFQYCDSVGQPSHKIDFNPNGSIHAVEAITSPCGRVLGKMGHSERRGRDVAKNIPGSKYQPLFEGGVDYFS